MSQIRKFAATFLIASSFSTIAPQMSLAQVTNEDVFRAESAIMSAGSRAGSVAKLKSIPSIGVVNLSMRIRPRFSDDVPDVEEFRISAQKNFAGINRLRAALRANPTAREELSRHGISINRVVGVSVSSNGSLRVYII